MATRLSRRRYVRALGVTGAGVVIGGCSDDGGEGGGGGRTGDVVDMTDDFLFHPRGITVGVGDTVTWENVGTVGHTVTAYEETIPEGADYFASGGFDSEGAARAAYVPGDPQTGDIPDGETWSYTFETPGTYEYFCIPHESEDEARTVRVEAD